MHSDTTAEAAQVRLAALRSISGAERLRRALEMSEDVRALAEAGRSARALDPRRVAKGVAEKPA